MDSVVREVLTQANMVILVLDYTQLSNKASDDVSQIIREFVSLVGPRNLLVLVNKVDQRRPADRELDVLGGVVKTVLQLDSEDTEDRLFKISARWAAVSVDPKKGADLLQSVSAALYGGS